MTLAKNRRRITMRILVCGGRDYSDAAGLFAVLDAIHHDHPVSEVIHGTARGADSLGAKWAKARRIPERPYPADWTKHGKSAGYRRNELMLADGKPDLVVVFPGGKGTAHMVGLTNAAGIPVRKIII
jgi:hypothetical protein